MFKSAGFFCAILLIIVSKTYGQDTVTVYFDLGKASVKLDEKTKLIMRLHENLNVIDSILCIGYTDSIGDINSNLILSQKRAKNVASEISEWFDKDIRTIVNSKGEVISNSNIPMRKTDVVVYLKNPSVETPLKLSKDSLKEYCANITVRDDSNCLILDVNIMKNLKFRPIIRKQDEIRLKVPSSSIDSNQRYFVGENITDTIQWLKLFSFWKTKYSVTSIKIKGSCFNGVKRFKDPIEQCLEQQRGFCVPDSMFNGLFFAINQGILIEQWRYDLPLNLGRFETSFNEVITPIVFFEIGGLMRINNFEVTLSTGTDSRLKWTGSIDGQYKFFSWYNRKVSFISEKPMKRGQLRKNSLFLGYELKGRYKAILSDSYLEQSMLTGLESVILLNKEKILRCYAQFAYRTFNVYNYYGNSNEIHGFIGNDFFFESGISISLK